ncbi:MAG: oxidoreductase [Betaproteobacteria bacterium]|nr:oxidoreductase [Betaproteobacteria bacterium]
MNNPTFSRLIFGAWRLADIPAEANTDSVAQKVFMSLEHGISTFDHADIYGNYCCEELFGDAVKKHKIPRNKMQLITKCGIKLVSPQRPEHGLKTYDTSREHIIRSVEQSLKNLKTDFVDLLLIHRPDPLMNPDEVADTFNALQQQGKVLHFGVSNFTTHQVRLLQSRLKAPLVTNQIEFSLLHTVPMYNGQLDQCLELNMKPMAWSPLAGGRLFTHSDDRSRNIRSCLETLAKKYRVEHAETIAYAWLMRHPAQILPVLGTGKEERLKAAVAALTVQLEHEDWFHLLKAAVGHDVP